MFFRESVLFREKHNMCFCEKHSCVSKEKEKAQPCFPKIKKTQPMLPQERKSTVMLHEKHNCISPNMKSTVCASVRSTTILPEKGETQLCFQFYFIFEKVQLCFQVPDFFSVAFFCFQTFFLLQFFVLFFSFAFLAYSFFTRFFMKPINMMV